MSKTNKVIISVCLCGAGTKKAQAPTVPYTPDEISDQVVECAKAGAATFTSVKTRSWTAKCRSATNP